ncbi:sensor protein SrrB [Gottschalkia acidurici 9a]|uniref:histidine kinase n=1 Tax=Gottschalkia acidurici (strain ATCC 7906 / DSM 604 / BCRC 14475 / CIP 104303 / KCTC 5404 / NCIMB 10678 / 9a) TaxID=1128398 RepID=K0B1G4_GOTA9|nr:HAMP domain-containing sensor histidine kinase [Gottschalkia acidurici]AFS79334.1 sensor protein SrrB [Gottschalkia acidurici 9a]
MRHSIRFKLSIVFTILIVSLQLIFFVVNAYFLEDIFIFGNKKMMIKMYEEYKGKLGEGYGQEELINNISEQYGGNITLIDENMNLIISTSSFLGRKKFDNRHTPTLELFNRVKDDIDEYVFFTFSPDREGRMNSIIFIGKISENKYLVSEKPIGDVRKSSDIAQKYIVSSGLVTITVGSIIIFFLSKKLTKPIISINDVAKEISKLNFNTKVNIDTNDELSVLGNSINDISDKLSFALTELQNANSKLQEDIERERNLEKMRRKFVSSVSHELKTPISMIQGYADGLKFNIAKNPDDMKYYCDVIIDESKKMNYLIKDLLDLSSYESGTFKIIKESFDITKMVENIIERYKKNLEIENITLDVDMPEKCIVNADKIRMEQVIFNFLNNAKKHVGYDGNISIVIKEIGNGTYMSVYNTGKHIKESEIDNIWTSFYKSNYNTSTREDGTGLGLAIVRAIIDLHDGKYGVKNIDNGVIFWIEIPN